MTSVARPARRATSTSRWAAGRVIELILWLAAALTVVMLQGALPLATAPRLTWVLALLPLAYGVRVFIGHGGPRATTLGLFNFACALFVGYSGTVAATADRDPTALHYLTLAILGSFIVQVLVTTLAWPDEEPSQPAGALTKESATWLTWTGLILLVVVYMVVRLEFVAASAISDGVAFTAVVLVAIGALYRPNSRLVSFATIRATAALAIYATFFFEGSGRLRLVALACTLLMLISARFPRRSIKWGVVVGTPAAVWWLAQERLSLQESLQAGGSAGRTGLESMTSAIVVFAQVIERLSAGMTPAWGSTFLSVPLLLVPSRFRGGWESHAIGYELVKITAPDRYGTGFSVVATGFGEWVYNFSWIGLVLAVPVLVWGLRLLDRRFRLTAIRLDGSRGSALKLAFMALLCGSIADLVWSGVHTFTARSLARVPILIVLAVFFARRKPRQAR